MYLTVRSKYRSVSKQFCEMEDLLPRLQRKTIEKFCLFIITRNNYIVIVSTSTGMVMFSQNLLNTIGTRKRSDSPKQEITCEC